MPHATLGSRTPPGLLRACVCMYSRRKHPSCFNRERLGALQEQCVRVGSEMALLRENKTAISCLGKSVKPQFLRASSPNGKAARKKRPHVVKLPRVDLHNTNRAAHTNVRCIPPPPPDLAHLCAKKRLVRWCRPHSYKKKNTKKIIYESLHEQSMQQ